MHKRFYIIYFLLLHSLSLQASVKLANGLQLDSAQLQQIQPIWIGDQQICTATLVGPNVIITVAHCEDTGLTFGSGNSKKAIVKFIPHPEYKVDEINEPYGLEVKYDVAIGILEENVTFIEPISITSQLPNVGNEVLIVGAGNPTPGIRKYGKVQVIKVSNQGVTFRGQKNTPYASNGDSGGPSLNIKSDGNVEVFGVMSSSIQNNDYTKWFGELGKPFTMASYSVYPSNRKDSFLKKLIKEHNLKICGINFTCPQVKFKH